MTWLCRVTQFGGSASSREALRRQSRKMCVSRQSHDTSSSLPHLPHLPHLPYLPYLPYLPHLPYLPYLN
ncbi:hypothetical protein [Laspinema olomoucense]|uniref:hypothetical protein n=1 Tax=Laspinema olomoucense TaxID=3231600 RepID=UPI0021BB7C8F|nr:hypothetical protein [Laspinema sp. D3a]MCT7988124.1 hypothetical protein [Laspinema sp. D3a]